MAELKKIVHVMRRFVPDKWGGTESVVFNLARELSREGIDSPVFCTDMLSAPGTENYGGIWIRRFRQVLPWFGLSKAAKEALALKGGSPLSLPLFMGLLKEKNVTLIHTHVQHRLGGMARTAARLKRIPYVVTIHGGHFTLPPEQIDKMTAPFRGKPEWGKIFGFLFGSRRVLRDADAILCVGENEYHAIRRRFPSAKVYLQPNGVNVDRYACADGGAFRAALGFKPSEKIVLCVSRIDYQKNQIGLVRAFASFSKTHPDHRLVLIGAVTVEEYYTHLLDEIAQQNLGDRVRIIPGMKPDDPLLTGAYKAAEMCVLASCHEPFGIVVLEAWAAGTPVLAYSVGGIAGFCTDHIDSLLIEPGHESKLAAGMTQLAEDANLREALSLNAFKTVKADYDWSVVAAQLRQIYCRILKD